MWSELLEEHARALAEGNEARRQRARLLAQTHSGLLALMDAAEQVWGALQPVPPRAEFRERLKAELLPQVGRRRAYTGNWRRTLRSYWLWGAVMSIISLAGGVGYYLHRRTHAV